MITSLRKIYSVVDVPQRHAAVFLMLLILLGMVMEAISVGMVIPALSLFTGESVGPSTGLTASIIQLINDQAGDTAVPFMATLLAASFLLRGLIVISISWIRERFIAGIRANISKRLFSSYLAQGYDFHLGQNSSTLVRNVIREATNFSSLLNLCFIFLSDVLIVTALLTLVFLVSPLGSICALFLFSSTWLLFHYSLGKKMPRWGVRRLESDGLRLQHAQQGLGAYKEIKLLGKEQAFVDFYEPHNKTSARMAQYKSFTKGIPRVMFETTAVLAVFVIILVQFFGDQTSMALVPKLGLFAMAAFRILPSINRLASGYNTIQFGKAVIDVIHQDLSLLSHAGEHPLKQPPATFSFEHEISIRDIHFRYSPSERDVLNGINLNIEKGEMIGFIGESGSGKSTIVDLLLGLLQPQSGKVVVDGIDVQNDLRSWQKLIGYVPQTVFLCDDTLAANIAFGLKTNEFDENRVREVIRESNLTDLTKGSPDGIFMSLGENGVKLSGGQRQRVGIARALYRNPEILVLDEATSALDKQTELQIIQTLEAMHSSKTILIISHRSSTLAFCDRILSLEKGILTELEKQASAYL